MYIPIMFCLRLLLVKQMRVALLSPWEPQGWERLSFTTARIRFPVISLDLIKLATAGRGPVNTLMAL